MKHPILIGAAFLALTALPAVAQDDTACPQNYSCVDYGSQVIEIDPSKGFIQDIVVEVWDLTITDFDGTRSDPRVKMATFIQGDDGFKLEREDIEPKQGIFKDAALGDVYSLEKQP